MRWPVVTVVKNNSVLGSLSVSKTEFLLLYVRTACKCFCEPVGFVQHSKTIVIVFQVHLPGHRINSVIFLSEEKKTIICLRSNLPTEKVVY